MDVSQRLLDFEGRKVRIMAKPQLVGFSTELACPTRCCNDVSDQILLCGSGSSRLSADCAFSIVIGSCDGDDCRVCCSHNIENRMLLAQGRLVRESGMIPGGFVLTNRNDSATMFSLADPELCYLK